MAISRAQLAKELEPGLNSLFGLEYNTYDQEYTEIFSVEDSDRAFEEEVLLTGLAPRQLSQRAKAYSSITQTKVTQPAIRTTRLGWLLPLPKRRSKTISTRHWVSDTPRHLHDLWLIPKKLKVLMY